jgi:hypothetical protein
MIDYIIYGIVDNGVMILGAMTGLELERLLPAKFKKGLGAVIGAGLGNAASDFMGGASTASWDLAIGTTAGCIIGLVFIPVLYYVGKLRQQYKSNTEEA